jgi:hypothetical protein
MMLVSLKAKNDPLMIIAMYVIMGYYYHLLNKALVE